MVAQPVVGFSNPDSRYTPSSTSGKRCGARAGDRSVANRLPHVSMSHAGRYLTLHRACASFCGLDYSPADALSDCALFQESNPAIIDDERRKNVFSPLMSLNMLIETTGDFDYTGADCQSWMRDAGFTDTRVESLAGPDSMVIGFE